MGHYDLFNVLSSTEDTIRTLPEMIKNLAPELRSYWLISCVDMNGLDLCTHFQVSREEVESSFAIDSGGYSSASGKVHISDMSPQKIAQIYTKERPLIGIGPDIPPVSDTKSEEAVDAIFRFNLDATKFRTAEMYATIGEQKKKYIYDVVQGRQGTSDQFNLKQREQWFTEISEVSAGRNNGYALGGMGHPNFSVDAYFALQPWSHRAKNCHLLGRGAIQLLPLLVYIGEHCYERLTSDCKTYTIEPLRFPKMFFQEPNTKITSVAFVGKHHNDHGKNLSCTCSACKYFQEELGTPLSELAEKTRRRDMMATYSLQEWAVTHNVIVIQKYVNWLKELVRSEKHFLKFLKDSGYSNTLEAIKVVNKLLDSGRKKYANNISPLLNN